MSILGQQADTRNNGTIYTVPAGRSALITKIWCFDDENTNRNYRFLVVPSSQTGAVSERHDIATNQDLTVDFGSGNGFFELQLPLTLGAGDQIRVIPGVTGGLPDSVTVFGDESTDPNAYATPLPNTLIGTTLTNVYTVPAGKQLAIATLIITNAASAARRVWLSFAKSGAADAASQYVLKNYQLAAREVYTFVGGITLDSGDVVRCKADVANDIALSIHGVLQ